MSTNDLVVVDEVAGSMQAELMRGLLEAQGIRVMLSEESAALAIGITIPAMGKVQIIVLAEFADAARKILNEYYMGTLEDETQNSEEASSSANGDDTEIADSDKE